MVPVSILEGVKLGRLRWRASSGIPGRRSSANAVASLPRSSSCARKMKLHCTEQLESERHHSCVSCFSQTVELTQS